MKFHFLVVKFHFLTTDYVPAQRTLYLRAMICEFQESRGKSACMNLSRSNALGPPLCTAWPVLKCVVPCAAVGCMLVCRAERWCAVARAPQPRLQAYLRTRMALHKGERWGKPRPLKRVQLYTQRLADTTVTTLRTARPVVTRYGRMVAELAARPLAYLTIPVVAALVGLVTNWMGVQMLFYPIEYVGVDWYRDQDSPYGLFGWQGVVPARTRVMAIRLVHVVTSKLLRLTEAFAQVDPDQLATLLQPTISDAIRRDAPNGEWWSWALQPFLHWALKGVVVEIQNHIEDVLDLEEVVMNAFLRDKAVLVDLFQHVGRVELEFLVTSGLYFGFLLGLGQMAVWAATVAPHRYSLPLAGAFVGYATNWIAIKLLFSPAEPVPLGPFQIQGMFEKRQPEVSKEFSEFLADRVLTSPLLIEELVDGKHKKVFAQLVRASVPFPIPDSVVDACLAGLRDLGQQPRSHLTHVYMADTLNIQTTLQQRLLGLSAVEFEDLLHPVFKEDEITLIAVGGVLGALAGLLQARHDFSKLPATIVTNVTHKLQH
eukprot:g28620.t1